jgi:hypothetical protein
MPVFLHERIKKMHDALGLKGKRLALQLGISESLLSALKSGQNKGTGDMFWRGVKREFPDWEPYLRGDTETPPSRKRETPYHQEEERMLPSPGKNLAFVVSGSEDAYLKKTHDILSSPEDDTASALKANIDRFHSAIQERREYDALKARMDRFEEGSKSILDRLGRLESIVLRILDEHKPPIGIGERRLAFQELKSFFENIPFPVHNRDKTQS